MQFGAIDTFFYREIIHDLVLASIKRPFSMRRVRSINKANNKDSLSRSPPCYQENQRLLQIIKLCLDVYYYLVT